MIRRLQRTLTAWRPEDRTACFAAYAILLCWCFPLVTAPEMRGPPSVVDWEWFLAYYQALYTTLVHHLQFPGFNPWMYLGTPLWANPQIGPISHFTPLVLLFGPLYGMKLGMAASYLISFEAGRALGRDLFKTPLATVIGGLLYAMSTALAAHWIQGQICFSAFALAPLLALWCLRLPRRPWAGAAAGAVLGLMLHYGVHYYVVYVALLCGLLCLALGVKHQCPRALARFGAQFFLSLLLVSGARLVPMLVVMGDMPRKLWLAFGLDGQALWHMFFVPGLDAPSVVLQIKGPGMIYQLTSAELYAYPGMLVLAMGLLSLRWGVRFFHWGFLLAFWLMLGTDQPWHLSRWLGKLPPFDSLWVVTRWRLVVLACLSLAAATALDHLLLWADSSSSPSNDGERWGRRRCRLIRGLAWLMPLELLLLLLPSWVKNVCPYRHQSLSRQELGLPASAHPLAVKELKIPRSNIPLFFAPFAANIGVVAGYEPLFGYLPAPSRRTFIGHPGYVGEYSQRGKPVSPTSWSPNRLRFDGLQPGVPLEININPGRGWSLNGEPIFEDHRLFELQRPFEVMVPASGAVDLSYRPPGLFAGLLLSLLSGLALLIWWTWSLRRDGAPRPAPYG